MNESMAWTLLAVICAIELAVFTKEMIEWNISCCCFWPSS